MVRFSSGLALFGWTWTAPWGLVQTYSKPEPEPQGSVFSRCTWGASGSGLNQNHQNFITINTENIFYMSVSSSKTKLGSISSQASLPWADHHDSPHAIFTMHQISLLLFDDTEGHLFVPTLKTSVPQGMMMQELPYNHELSAAWQGSPFPGFLTMNISVGYELNTYKTTRYLPPTMEWPQDMLASRPTDHGNIVPILQKGSHWTGGGKWICLAEIFQWYNPSSYQQLIDLKFYISSQH